MKREPVTGKIWSFYGLTRREFLSRFALASGAVTLSPFFVERWCAVMAQSAPVRVYVVKNGDCFQNTAKIWEMLGGPSRYIGSSDIVVIKGNCQGQNQGYTHTGVIKGVIDGILGIPGFAGEVLICDNTQLGAGFFNADPSSRLNNWPDHSWVSLAADYQSRQKPVATKQWYSSQADISGPADGEGWIRSFFDFNGMPTYLSYPVFQSPLTPGRMIDMKNGVWEGVAYTGRAVKTIQMPTLNYHSDYAGHTSAIKSFFGSTEIHNGPLTSAWRGYYAIHPSSFRNTYSCYAGNLAGRYIQTMYAPVLYVTAAMWSGHASRTGPATETKTVLACENPATLDYIACRDVISPYNAALDPDADNNTRRQILGCVEEGVGTIDPMGFEVISYDFGNPSATRLDVDRAVMDHKAGRLTEQEVKDVIRLYMETP